MRGEAKRKREEGEGEEKSVFLTTRALDLVGGGEGKRPHVHSVTEATCVRDVMRLMERHSLSSCPITSSEGAFLGFVDTLDIAAHMMGSWKKSGGEGGHEALASFFDTHVGDVLSHAPGLAVEEDCHVADLLHLFARHHRAHTHSLISSRSAKRSRHGEGAEGSKDGKEGKEEGRGREEDEEGKGEHHHHHHHHHHHRKHHKAQRHEGEEEREGRIHRVALISPSTGKISGVLSQSDLVRFLHRHVASLPPALRETKVKELPAVRSLVFVRLDGSFVDTLELLLAHRITGLALVDADFRLAGNFSANDLRGLTPEAFDYFLGSTLQFMVKGRKGDIKPPHAVTPDTSVEELLSLFASKRVHRLYVSDENSRPHSVLTLGDVIHLFDRDL